MVYLEIKEKNDSLFFQAKMNGGLPEERTAVHRFAQQNPPFKVDKSVYAKYQNLYCQEVLEGAQLSGMDDSTLEATLGDAWAKFVVSIVEPMSRAAAMAGPTPSA